MKRNLNILEINFQDSNLISKYMELKYLREQVRQWPFAFIYKILFQLHKEK